ncbi:hypothetical protein [Qipengyuania sediminis]|uniref:hypothetical protein n=1 Tax=Qipengyuania sediminis TaxID=1532023 RepID=UPI00105A6B04|nr:hypothetical protein [Qipengyuania sediminis]
MYSDEDLNSAVAAGALSADAASALRAHVSAQREMPSGDEENFRLVNSFNDIFVSIAIVIMLVAASAIGTALAGLIAPVGEFDFSTDPAAMDGIMAASQRNGAWDRLLSGLLIAATAWPLAEAFTRRRRMALPSIILLLAFVGGVFSAAFGLGTLFPTDENVTAASIMISLAGLVAAGAAYLHWKRFMVPITVAAGVAALTVTVLGLLVAALEAAGAGEPENILLWLVFAAGLAIFALAMRWDISDRERVTRRSDVAFWLHLLAAPMIAHPIFYSLGILGNSEDVGIGSALAVVAIYVLFGIVAVLIDRRALLVSALAYVLAALAFLFDRFGAVELTFALTALVIGSALLTLSAFWTPLRSRLLALLPADWQARVPPPGAVKAMPRVAEA